jgi:signal transduction histidine kinase
MSGSARDGTAARSPSRVFRLFVLLLAAGAAALLPDSLQAVLEHPVAPLAWLLLISGAAFFTTIVVPSTSIEASVSLPVVTACIVVTDPPVAFLASVLAIVSPREFSSQTNRWMVVFNHLQRGLAIYATALLVHALPFGAVARTLVALLVFDLLNSAFVALAVWLLGRQSLREAVTGALVPFPRFASQYLVTGLLALLVVLLYTEVGPWSVGLLAVPLWLGYAGLRSARVASERADELALRVRELEVVHDLGTALLPLHHREAVAQLGARALREICQGCGPGAVVVALDGAVPAHLRRKPLPGTDAAVGLPADLDERLAAQAETVCNTIGLALQRLVVEEELRASQRAQAELAEGILSEGTAARSRVALYVHDEVLPFLAAAQIQCENVVTAAERGNVPLTTKLALLVRDAVSDGIRTLREVLDDLRQQTIVPGDLVPTIRRAAEKAHLEHGLQVRLDTQHYRGGISHPVEILLTETVTGLLTNVVRHARASMVRVRVANEEGLVVAEVSDDGVGFDPDAVGAGHHGLALVRQRAAIANGRFSVTSAPGLGTTIRLEVPAGTTGLTQPPSVLGQPELAQTGQPDPAAVEREPAVR